MKLPR